MTSKLDTYFKFLMEALQITQDSKGDPPTGLSTLTGKLGQTG